MNTRYPVYTEKTQCQDCYRCVRTCPVKAIKIEQGSASVVEELCIHCGECVNICPNGAKKVRDDSAEVARLLNGSAPVYASLAPSFRSEFAGVDERCIVEAIKKLGFAGVSETALGAQEVSGHLLGVMDKPAFRKKIMISTACPVVVNHIRKYYPSLTGLLTPVLSPMLAHCRMLKEWYPGSRVVFFGPCIAKKDEPVLHGGLCDGVLTFENLRTMLATRNVRVGDYGTDGNMFVPRRAEEGAMYPVDGGMVAVMQGNGMLIDRRMMYFSGMTQVASVLESLLDEEVEGPVFLELLACAGGCINGPVRPNGGGGILTRRIAVLDESRRLQWNRPVTAVKEIDGTVVPVVSDCRQPTPEEILKVLRATGKYCDEDELNCGGCGYGNCRDFARAVVDGRAETAMCVTYMRKLANKKANKLITAMPLGVVIVDSALRIIECNARFAALAGEDAVAVYGQHSGMGGAVLEKVLPVSSFFRHVLSNGDDIAGKEITVGGRLLRCSIFTIEPGSIAGGVFSDITDPEMKREEIINRARQVISNNLSTVQKIAYLLGENAAETEMVLSGIIDCFDPKGKE